MLQLKYLIHLIIFILTLAIAIVTSADNKHLSSVVLAVEDSWPPYADINGEGISTNILKAALASVDIDLTLKVVPYARVLYEVEQGIIVGGYNVTRQELREEQYLFGEEVLLNAPASFFFPPDQESLEAYKSIADIPDGANIGIIIDFEYGDVYEQHKHRFKEVKVSQQTQIINMLKQGRLDTAIMFDAVALYTLDIMNLPANTIHKGPLNHLSNIHVAFSKSHKDSEYFSEKLDQGLINIKKNGLYNTLLKY